MKFSENRVLNIAVTVIFLCSMLFTNFFSMRVILRSGVDVYFYDKLLVAYNIGGLPGLKVELNKITLTDKLRREAILAKDFAARLETLQDPGAFLTEKVNKNKSTMSFIRNMRSVAISILLIIFSWQLIAEFLRRAKSGKYP
jgi:hypothetical protein